MSIIDSVKKYSFFNRCENGDGLFRERSGKNIPKAMSMMDKVLPDGWYEGQRAAFRKASQKKGTGIS